LALRCFCPEGRAFTNPFQSPAFPALLAPELYYARRVYIKTAFFSLSDQANNSPPKWGDGFGGYAKRTGSRYGQFVTQNALSAAGNALLGLNLDAIAASAPASGPAHAMLLSGTS
jgi:hypothetical protein